MTTGNITGTVTDAQGGVLPGATVVATHTYTGTNYEAVPGGDGRYTIRMSSRSARGHTANMSGFKDQFQDKVHGQLGAEQTADFKLALGSGERDGRRRGQHANDRFRARGSGHGLQHSRTRSRRSLPTISAAASPTSSASARCSTRSGGGAGDSASVVSVAGSSPRYNSIQIDGAVNNDLFAISQSKPARPAAPTGTQPISLDAIEELQLVVSPYDVRQGSFTGGGINAPHSRSGSNRLPGHGLFTSVATRTGSARALTDTKISELQATSRAASASAARS